MTHINDFWLTEYCTDIAQEIVRDAKSLEQAIDWAGESADGSEYAIYTYKAHMLCQNCDVTNGKEFVRDCYGETHLDYDAQASAIAYGEIHARIVGAIYDNFEAWKEGEQ